MPFNWVDLRLRVSHEDAFRCQLLQSFQSWLGWRISFKCTCALSCANHDPMDYHPPPPPAPLSMGLPRQGYWSGLSFPTPGDLLDLGIEPSAPEAPALPADSSPLSHLGRPPSSRRSQFLPLWISPYSFSWHGSWLLPEQMIWEKTKAASKITATVASQVALVVKNPPANAGAIRGASSITGLGR